MPTTMCVLNRLLFKSICSTVVYCASCVFTKASQQMFSSCFFCTGCVYTCLYLSTRVRHLSIEQAIVQMQYFQNSCPNCTGFFSSVLCLEVCVLFYSCLLYKFCYYQCFAANVQQLGLLYRLCIYLYVPFNKCSLFVYLGCVFICALKYVFNRCLLYVQVLSLTMPRKCSIVVAIVQAMPCRYCSRVVYCIGCLF